MAENSASFFSGKSQGQSFSFDRNFKAISGEGKILEILNSSEEPVNEETITAKIYQGRKESPHWVSIVLDKFGSEGKVVKTGPKLWISADKHLKNCDVKSIFGCIAELLKEFNVVSVRFITHYVNEKLGLTLSYYSYDSLLRITKKETAKLGSYYKGFLTKDGSHFSEESIDKKVSEKIDLLENLSKIQKDGIAITKSEFMNIVNRLDAQKERASRS